MRGEFYYRQDPNVAGWRGLFYWPLPYRSTQQDNINWVYPDAVQQSSGFTTNWLGNQLPGNTNQIPGVSQASPLFTPSVAPAGQQNMSLYVSQVVLPTYGLNNLGNMQANSRNIWGASYGG